MLIFAIRFCCKVQYSTDIGTGTVKLDGTVFPNFWQRGHNSNWSSSSSSSASCWIIEVITQQIMLILHQTPILVKGYSYSNHHWPLPSKCSRTFEVSLKTDLVDTVSCGTNSVCSINRQLVGTCGFSFRPHSVVLIVCWSGYLKHLFISKVCPFGSLVLYWHHNHAET